MKFTSGASNEPVIREFTSDNTVVKNGESFILSWRVNADKIELYRNGVFFETLSSSQRSIERTEFYDSDKEVFYELVVYKNGIQTRSNPVVIRSYSYAATLSAASLNPEIINHLSATASWARFISIAGMVACIFAIIAIIIDVQKRSSDLSVLIYFIIGALILLVPMYFLSQFANKIKSAITADNNNIFNYSFKSLKNYFVYTGVIIITFLVIIIFIIVAKTLE